MESLEALETHKEIGTGRTVEEESRFKRLAVGAFALFMFFFFLLLKLPEARISNFALAHIRIIAQDQGFSFSAEKMRLGIVLGPSIKLYNVELKSLEDDKQVVKIPFIKLKPKLLSLVMSTKKAAISVELPEGEISGVAGFSPTRTYVDLDFDSVNLAQVSILKKFLIAEVTAKINGNVSIDLNGEDATKSEGRVNLKLTDVVMPAQNLMGFNLPQIKMKESTLDVAINQGKMTFQNVSLGTDLKNDDIVAKVTGDGMIDRMIDRSKVNGAIVFELSRNVINSFPILESLLTPAKTPNGKYNYRFSGPLYALDVKPGV